MGHEIHQADKGILQAEAGRQRYKLSRYQCSRNLQTYIKHYWIVKWDLRGEAPYRQVVLSHPNVNMVFEKDNTRVYGIPKKTSSQLLDGEGKVLGVMFRPAGFYPFRKKPLSELTGRSLPFKEAFGVDGAALEAQILEQEDESLMVELVDRFFEERLPEPDENVELVNRIVDMIALDRGISKVEDAADRLGINKRTMQRLFSRYVGVSPKWVIQRQRLHEAAELIESGKLPDWAKLSQDLGYYDQAHFIKEFKAIVGYSPEAYFRKIGQ